MMNPIIIKTAGGWIAFDPKDIRSIDYVKSSGLLSVYFKPPIPANGVTSFMVDSISENDANDIYTKWHNTQAEVTE